MLMSALQYYFFFRCFFPNKVRSCKVTTTSLTNDKFIRPPFLYISLSVSLLGVEKGIFHLIIVFLQIYDISFYISLRLQLNIFSLYKKFIRIFFTGICFEKINSLYR